MRVSAYINKGFMQYEFFISALIHSIDFFVIRLGCKAYNFGFSSGSTLIQLLNTI